MKIQEILKKITKIPTVSGKELDGDFNHELSLILSKNPSIKVKRDGFNNIIIDIFPDLGSRNILIEAHYDEIPLSLAYNLNSKISKSERFDYVFKNSNNLIKSIGLDNKVSVSAILYSIDSLFKISQKTKTSIRILFSAGEEIRKTQISHLFPKKLDLYVVMDAAYAKPTKFDQEKKVMIPDLGGGTVIQLEGIGFKISKKLINLAKVVAKKNGIRYQFELPPKGFGYTNCAIFQKLNLKNGIVINTPVRYQHEKVSEVSLFDIKETSRLLIEVVKKIAI